VDPTAALEGEGRGEYQDGFAQVPLQHLKGHAAVKDGGGRGGRGVGTTATATVTATVWREVAACNAAVQAEQIQASFVEVPVVQDVSVTTSERENRLVYAEKKGLTRSQTKKKDQLL
jgi:hypothetical protein